MQSWVTSWLLFYSHLVVFVLQLHLSSVGPWVEGLSELAL